MEPALQPFVTLGQRIALRREMLAITQVQLAETLGISQQAMNSFGKGRRRVPVSLLPVIAQALDTTLDALVNDEAHTTAAAPKKHGPQKKIQQQMKLIETLPSRPCKFHLRPLIPIFSALSADTSSRFWYE